MIIKETIEEKTLSITNEEEEMISDHREGITITFHQDQKEEEEVLRTDLETETEEEDEE